ncbi:phosphatidylserine decarboxylase [Porcipelethomonas sp.]|uniref:phosphatidylserine decarboxylase n=1 Tax=Porcipelethomonas sp. TaxID=2981675 RepID=UPI003EF85B0F
MEYGIKDRQGNIIPSAGSQQNILDIIYRSAAGNIALKGLTAPVVSKMAGAFCNSMASAKLIPAFIKSSGINMLDYEPGRYRSYNDFFTRKIRPEARPVNMNPDILISPCDSRLTVYKINEDSRFEIKGTEYSVSSFLKCEKLARKYNGGYFMIFRLEVSDYHRYIYIDSGSKSGNVHINGVYHTVNPVALDKADIYKENTREFTILHTDNFGNVIQAEVGAMMVGKITNHHQKHSFARGEEKGMFEFGGSTVVLIVKPGIIIPDKDITDNTNAGFETIVKMGEGIGVKIKNERK